MNKAIFLDRDGVINRKGDSYYVYLIEDFEFNEGVIEALRLFISKGYLLIVITNQGGIAKKAFTETQLSELHNYMKEELELNDASVTHVYHCPHHPDYQACDCRKPGSLLFEKAIKEYDIDTSASFMIGDSDIDIMAAEKAGIRGIRIETNSNLMELFKVYNF